MRTNRSLGFTVIELLVVIAIVAIINIVSFLLFALFYTIYRWIKRDLDPEDED